MKTSLPPLFRKRSGGFSLVEMIVVVAILCTLATLCISGWKVVRTTFLRTQCQYNLRQIHGGLLNYATENSNRLPVGFGPPYTGQDTAWSYYVWPYIYGSYANFKYPDNCLQMSTPVYRVCPPNVFRCPATKEKMVPAPTAGSPYPARFSYGLNDTPARSALYLIDGIYIVPLSLVTSPAATAMVVECSFPAGGYSRYFDNYGLIPHAGGMNVLYFDGHVEWLTFAQIPRSTTDVFWIGR